MSKRDTSAQQPNPNPTNEKFYNTTLDSLYENEKTINQYWNKKVLLTATTSKGEIQGKCIFNCCCSNGWISFHHIAYDKNPESTLLTGMYSMDINSSLIDDIILINEQKTDILPESIKNQICDNAQLKLIENALYKMSINPKYLPLAPLNPSNRKLYLNQSVSDSRKQLLAQNICNVKIPNNLKDDSVFTAAFQSAICDTDITEYGHAYPNYNLSNALTNALSLLHDYHKMWIQYIQQQTIVTKDAEIDSKDSIEFEPTFNKSYIDWDKTNIQKLVKHQNEERKKWETNKEETIYRKSSVSGVIISSVTITENAEDTYNPRRESYRIRELLTAQTLPCSRIAVNIANTRNKLRASVTENKIADPPKILTPKISLSKKTTGWTGRHKMEENTMEVFARKIRFTLNKLTTSNFCKLSKQLIDIFMNEVSDTKLHQFITLIFEKAISAQEYIYTQLYVKLCHKLSSICSMDFKAILFEICKTGCGFDKGDIVCKNELIKHRRLLGTMSFIGQLYVEKLLSSSIITIVLEHLMRDNINSQCSDDIEYACTLLMTIHSVLDNDMNINKIEINKYYQKLISIQRGDKYGYRIAMIIQNLMNLRTLKLE